MGRPGWKKLEAWFSWRLWSQLRRLENQELFACPR